MGCFLLKYVTLPELISFIVSVLSIIIAARALRISSLKVKFSVMAGGEQTFGKNSIWIAKLTISNVGFTSLSITGIIDKKGDIINLNNVFDLKFPIKLEPGDVQTIDIPYSYRTKTNQIYAVDHRSKKHKIRIKGKPPILIPNSFKHWITTKELRTFKHLWSFLKHKIKS